MAFQNKMRKLKEQEFSKYQNSATNNVPATSMVATDAVPTTPYYEVSKKGDCDKNSGSNANDGNGGDDTWNMDDLDIDDGQLFDFLSMNDF